MNEKIDLSEFNMSDAELFSPVNHDDLASERITAPRYSYWKSVFRVFFKNKLNVTPYKFILAKKLNEAKNAMKSGMNITNACEWAGFNDYANFITLFKKHFGITPKKWIMTYTDSKK